MSDLVATENAIKFQMQNSLRIERIVAAGCDFLPSSEGSENNILVGVIGNGDPQNPLSHQAIRIGDSEAYRLRSYIEGQDSLTYNFDKNVSLTLMKRNNSILYNLKASDIDVTREVDPAITKYFKPISMSSEELDKIAKLYKQICPVEKESLEMQ